MSLCDELLFTLGAHEGPLPSMGSHMSLEVPSLRELFQTLFKGANEYLLLIFGSFDLFDSCAIVKKRNMHT